MVAVGHAAMASAGGVAPPRRPLTETRKSSTKRQEFQQKRYGIGVARVGVDGGAP
jgi:hypothetical protein